MIGHRLDHLRKADIAGVLAFALAIGLVVIAAVNAGGDPGPSAPRASVGTTPEPSVLGSEVTEVTEATEATEATDDATMTTAAPTSSTATTGARPAVVPVPSTSGPDPSAPDVTLIPPVSITAPPRTTTTTRPPTTTTTQPTTTTTEATTTTSAG